MRICKIENCDSPSVKNAFLCAEHMGDKRRCEGRVRTYDEHTGEVLSDRQCKRSARPGNTTCTSHGANSPKATESAKKAQALSAMERFVAPYAGSLDPYSAFEAEYRRTYGRIVWLEAQIANLADENDLIWGKTREEHLGATEFSGTNTTYEARIHVWEDMLRWERRHLLDLTKVALKADIEKARLGMMQRAVESTYTATVRLLTDLGLDTADPLVRDKIRRMFDAPAELH